LATIGSTSTPLSVLDEQYGAFLEKTPFRKHRIKTVPASAANIYDSSLLIQKEGSINPDSVTHQKGRRLFSWKELFLCLFGMPQGEELEVILYKE